MPAIETFDLSFRSKLGIRQTKKNKIMCIVQTFFFLLLKKMYLGLNYKIKMY